MSSRILAVAKHLLAAGLIVTVVACGEPTLTAIDGGVLSMQIVSGDGQTGPAGEELPLPLVVQALDDKGKGIPDILLNFRVVIGGGSMFAGAGITNKNGIAQDYLTLGPEPGENVVEVRAVDATTGDKLVFATFTATTVAPAILFDETEFLTASNAQLAVTYPNVRAVTSDPYVENGVTFIARNEINDFTPLLPDNEFGISGIENFDLTFDWDVTAFGMWMQDGFAIGEINAPGVDSRFQFTVVAGTAELGSFVVDPPIDEAFFIGIISDLPFDRVEIRELAPAGIENDFFGRIYTAPGPPNP